MGLFDFFRKVEWRVDPAQPKHAAQIAELHAASFARGWSVAEIERLMADRNTVTDILRAKARSQTIDGFSLSRIAVDEAELLSIAVSSKRRGKGGSSPLLARHLARLQAAGARRVVLEVDEQNVPALRLYARFGFSEIGTRPAYYARPDGTRGQARVLARALG
ncbi:ribosomal-protein-alanine acetyltransferase [Terrihabitans soli]|uniref:Ribosomal-protein-alanine acetyltransferase n=1 Tax=Terrihabitans soli TaxID=708113 RepID=A0A6S6QJC3_9HYPH|nr:GNAT family N-acetyltransferase [Terrihabitans soli]BCJ89296.1 ribosomal-protein-alanine acetyltransferase [Terrihabitans soli]